MIPGPAELRVDCRAPAGMEPRRRACARIAPAIPDGLELEFARAGRRQPLARREPADGRDRRAGSAREDPGAVAVPTVLPAFTDSRWWRHAFPDCVAYGFFPQRHQTLVRRLAAHPRRRRAHRRPRPRLRGRVLLPPPESAARMSDDRREAPPRRHGPRQRPARARPDALGRRRAHARRADQDGDRPQAAPARRRRRARRARRRPPRRGDGRHPARQARPARGATALPARVRRRRDRRAPPPAGALLKRRAGGTGRARLGAAAALPRARAVHPARRRGRPVPRGRAQGDRRLRAGRRRRARRRQGARALRLAPRRADDGVQPRRHAAAAPRPRAPGPAGRRRRRPRLHRRRRRGLPLGASSTPTAASPAPSARPGFAIQRAIGTREPDERQLEVGRAALAEILGAEGVGSPPQSG